MKMLYLWLLLNIHYNNFTVIVYNLLDYNLHRDNNLLFLWQEIIQHFLMFLNLFSSKSNRNGSRKIFIKKPRWITYLKFYQIVCTYPSQYFNELNLTWSSYYRFDLKNRYYDTVDCMCHLIFFPSFINKTMKKNFLFGSNWQFVS